MLSGDYQCCAEAPTTAAKRRKWLTPHCGVLREAHLRACITMTHNSRGQPMATSYPPSRPMAAVPYDDSFEFVEEAESQTSRELADTLLEISSVTFEDSGVGLRSVHAKSHGLLHGELRVLDLPLPYAQGMFSEAAVFPATIRLSTSPGDILDDRVSTPRGFALKVSGVKGDRLPGSEDATTQDFLLVNGPAFLAPSAAKFLGSLKLLATTTDKVPRLKRAFSAVLRGTEKVIEALGGESATLKGLGGHPQTHVLGETYFSQVPFLYGLYMAKWSIAPVSPELLQLKDAPVDLDDRPDGLREAVVAFFRSHGAEWELRVQLCTDLERMPLEDASVRWPEELSPFVPVARLWVPPQPAWDAACHAELDESLSFSPWHGVMAHRPLGSVNRVRREAYEASAGARMARSRCPVHEASSRR
jgi:hypothetical protein